MMFGDLGEPEEILYELQFGYQGHCPVIQALRPGQLQQLQANSIKSLQTRYDRGNIMVLKLSRSMLRLFPPERAAKQSNNFISRLLD